jgi:hypothetical protein
MITGWQKSQNTPGSLLDTFQNIGAKAGRQQEHKKQGELLSEEESYRED